MSHSCPVCAFPELMEPPRTPSGGGSYEICPSCGFQFGVSDDDAGFTYATWRQQWRKEGCPWAGHGRPAPGGWDPELQMKGRSSAASLVAAKKAKQTARGVTQPARRRSAR